MDVESSVIQAENMTDNIVEMVPEEGIPAYGIMYIFEEPVQLVKIIANTLLEKFDYYLGSLIGYRMAWSDMLTPWFIIIMFVLLLIGAGLWVKEEKEPCFTSAEKCVTGGLVIASVLAFHMLMLIETPVGSTIINGVQGRYFIAWLPLILMITSGKEIVIEKVKVKRLYFYFSVASVFYFYFFLINIFGLK